MSSLPRTQTVTPPVASADLAILDSALDGLSPDVRRGLAAFRDALEQGSAVRVEPLSTMLTTGQAAEILNVSRVTVVKLLDEGALPYQQPRNHRLIKLEDVITYKDERSRVRQQFFEDSVSDAIANGSFDVSFVQAAKAVRSVRRRRKQLEV